MAIIWLRQRLGGGFNSSIGNQPGDSDYVTFYNKTSDAPEDGRGWRIDVAEGDKAGNQLANTKSTTFQGAWGGFTMTTLLSDAIAAHLLLEPGMTDEAIRELILLILQHEHEHTPGDEPGEEDAPGGDDVPDEDPDDPTEDSCEHLALYMRDAARACDRASHYKTVEQDTGESQCVTIHVICRFYRFVMDEANKPGNAERCPDLDPDGDGEISVDCETCTTYIEAHPHCLSSGGGYELEEVSPVSDNNYFSELIQE